MAEGVAVVHYQPGVAYFTRQCWMLWLFFIGGISTDNPRLLKAPL